MRINRKIIKKKPMKSLKNFNSIEDYKIVKIIPFTIIIPFTHNKTNCLQDCLYYLNKCSGISLCEVLLILYENEYFEYDFSKYKNLNYKIIHSKRNNPDNMFCLSHARNIGMVNASNDWVLMLDCDIFVPPNICKRLSHDRTRIENNIYGTTRVNIPSHENYSNLDILYNKKTLVEKGFVGFFHFFNRKTIMSLIGGYFESFIGYGYEDSDLIERARLCGMKIEYLKYCDVYHINHERIDGFYNQDYIKKNKELHEFILKNNIIKNENKIGIIIK